MAAGPKVDNVRLTLPSYSLVAAGIVIIERIQWKAISSPAEFRACQIFVRYDRVGGNVECDVGDG